MGTIGVTLEEEEIVELVMAEVVEVVMAEMVEVVMAEIVEVVMAEIMEVVMAEVVEVVMAKMVETAGLIMSQQTLPDSSINCLCVEPSRGSGWGTAFEAGLPP